jgi:hypothetical protein
VEKAYGRDVNANHKRKQHQQIILGSLVIYGKSDISFHTIHKKVNSRYIYNLNAKINQFSEENIEKYPF